MVEDAEKSKIEDAKLQNYGTTRVLFTRLVSSA